MEPTHAASKPTLAHCAQETDDYDCCLAHVPDQVLRHVLQPSRMLSVDQRMQQIMRKRSRMKRTERQQVCNGMYDMFGREEDEGSDEEEESVEEHLSEDELEEDEYEEGEEDHL